MTDQFDILEPFDAEAEFGPCAGIVSMDVERRVLMQLRDDYDHVEAGGKWSLFGGGIEDGETPRAACIREVSEELGIDLRAQDITPWIKTTSYIGRRWYIFKTNLPIVARDISLNEGVGFGYLTQNQVMDFDLHPTARAVMAHAFTQK